MVQERPRRRGRRGRARPKKEPPKEPLVSEEEQLPGLLEGEIPEQPPVTEEEVMQEEQPAAAEEVAVAAVGPAPEPEPVNAPEKATTLPGTLMSVPEFRQQVIRLVVRKLR